MTQAPARICRFQSSFRLFSDFDMDLVESLLSPDALVADWDTRVYNEQFDSSENLNTWDPAAAAIGYGINTAARLAWENACTDSPPGPQELRSIQHWLADELSVPVKELPSPDDLLLPPHLRRDYQNRGWIARSD